MESHVAVIGAGPAGSVCAQELQRARVAVTVFEKARGPGGRTARRREEPWHFDHGAQYLTVRTPEGEQVIASLASAGVVAEWRPRIYRYRNGALEARPPAAHPRYVGVPGMSSICRHLLRNVSAELERRVVSAEYRGGAWSIADGNGAVFEGFTHLIVTTPPKQAVEIVRTEAELHDRIASVDMAPCWALMVGLEAGSDFPADGVFVDNPGNPLAWIARNSSKPGRPQIESWVAHASSIWSTENLELDHGEAEAVLLEAFHDITGIAAKTVGSIRAHRWRYAKAGTPLGQPFVGEPGRRLAFGGDWCVNGRIEGALVSGLALARHVLGR